MSQSHVFTVASGFGLRVIPVATPYELALGPDATSLDVWRHTAQGPRFARLTPNAGGYTSKIASGTATLDEVLNVVHGPDCNLWWIETSLYKLSLPPAWRVSVCGDPTAPSVFDLLGPEQALIFVQTPEFVPEIDQFMRPGQRFYARGTDQRSEWVEFRYEHEKTEWTQRYDVLQIGDVACVLTFQAPVSAVASTSPAHRTVLASLTPRGRPEDVGQ